MKYEFYKIISYKYYHFVLFSITVITALLCFYSSLSSQVYMSRESLSSDIQQLHEDYLLNLDILNSDAISNSDKNHIKTNIYRNSEYIFIIIHKQCIKSSKIFKFMYIFKFVPSKTHRTV